MANNLMPVAIRIRCRLPTVSSTVKRLRTVMTPLCTSSHILGNMVFLWAFGPEVEDLMTRRRYLTFYLLGGVAAALAQLVARPTSMVPNLGASGAIAAVMGAFVGAYAAHVGGFIFSAVSARIFEGRART